MFQNYLKIAFRNLWKNKGYAAINTGGLAIGLAGFIVLLLYINYQKSYDQWSPQLKNIYQVNTKESISSSTRQISWMNGGDTRIAPLLENNLPGVQSVTKVIGSFDHTFNIIVEDKDFSVNMNSFWVSDSSFFKVFPYLFIAGNPNHALDKLHSMVITDSLALKWFGSVQAIGRSVTMKSWRKDPGTVYEITGVVKKINTPTTMPFKAIYNSGELNGVPADPRQTDLANIYVRLNAPRPDSVLEKQVNKIYKASFAGLLKQRHTSLDEYIKSGREFGIRLMPLQKVHLYPLNSESVMNKLMPVLALSVLLLLIAMINFANLSTAQVIGRAKEAGVRKVIGANKRSLILQFFLQAAIQCMMALVIALLIVELCLPLFNQLFDTSLSVWFYHHAISLIWWQLIVIILVTILLSGIYPAFFMASFDPVKVLKGNFSRGIQGIRVRNTLVIIQFLIAAGFIIGIGVIQKQVNYMVHADLGFQPSGLIDLNIGYDRQFAERLKTIPGVTGVGTTNQIMGNSMAFMNNIKYKGEDINVYIASVSIGTLKAMQVTLLAGRLFSSQYGQDTSGSVILNESAAKLLGGNVIGKTLVENGSLTKHIIGVIADYHYEGFDKKVLPTIYGSFSSPGHEIVTNNLICRIDANHFNTTISAIKNVWNKFFYPGFPLHYTFIEESFHQTIANDIRFRKIVSAFTLLSLILSLVGIFALSAFITTNRTKEIGIRRVLGASMIAILKLLNKKFIILVVIANIIAWPVTYILAQKWLNGFAYRIDMPVWPFVIATVLSVVLTILTVSLQAWRAARANPVEALKYE